MDVETGGLALELAGVEEGLTMFEMALEDGLLPAAEDETTGDEETTGEDETTDGCGATLTGALWDGVTTPEEETGVLE